MSFGADDLNKSLLWDASPFCKINSMVFELCSKNVELILQKGERIRQA
jgi:hypothetical protein